MKYCGGLLLSVSSVAVLVCVTKGCERDCVTLTAETKAANVSVDGGLVCPEPIRLTCRTLGVEGSSSLRWTDVSNAIIDGIPTYNFQEDHEFPRTILQEDNSSAFISYEVENADFDDVLRSEVNFTAVLVVNPELLFSSGQRTLKCGGLSKTDDFTINLIDMEVPEVPTNADFNLVYDLSSYLLQQFRVQIARPVYNSSNPCQYKEETYFNTTLLLGNTISMTNIADASCPGPTCSIEFQNIPELSDQEDFGISVTLGNRFGESSPTTFDGALFPASVESLFNLSVSYTDCQTRVECTVFRTSGVPDCTIRYGTDSSFQNFSQTSFSVNESSLLSGLSERTVYHVEAIFTSESRRGNYSLRTTYETGSCLDDVNVGAVVGGVVAFLAAILVVAIITITIFAYECRKGSGRQSYAGDQGSQDRNIEAVNMKSVEDNHGPDGDLSKQNPEIEYSHEHRKINENKEKTYLRQAAEEQEPNQYYTPTAADTLADTSTPVAEQHEMLATPLDTLTL